MSKCFTHGQTVRSRKTIEHYCLHHPPLTPSVRATVFASIDNVVLILPHNSGHEMIVRAEDLILDSEKNDG